jgi:dihydrodipicolinate synthase/N-acetylneuraminate lyase
MIEAFHAGDYACAARLHGRSLAMTKILFSFPSPVPTKVALETLGVLPNCVVRLPHVPPTAKERESVEEALRRYGRIDAGTATPV